MEAKHTPGPWHESVGEIRAANGFCIATMEPPHPAAKGKDRAEHRSYQQANARLIAAAPDLLAAVDRLLSSYQCLCAGTPVRDLDEVLVFAHNVLAKALGNHSTPLPDEAMAGEQEID